MIHEYRQSIEALKLRPLREDDLPTTLLWRNRDRAVFWHSEFIDDKQHRAWYEKYLLDPCDITFVAEIDGRPVGQVALYNLSETTAEFGRLLVAAPGHGWGRLATRGALLIASKQLALQSVYLGVKRDNEAAIRLYEEVGFVADGCGPHDSVAMRIVFQRLVKP